MSLCEINSGRGHSVIPTLAYTVLIIVAEIITPVCMKVVTQANMRTYYFVHSWWKNVRAFSSGPSPKLPWTEYQPKEYQGPRYEEIQKLRSTHLAPCITSHYKNSLLVHQGKNQWLFDYKGRRYLDMFGGIVTISVGHCHPKVNEALKEQVDTLWHTTNIYLHPKVHEYAEKLTSKLPGDLKVVYFVNSGSEANDLAMLLARLHTKHFDIISLRNGYHGMSPYTMGLTALSAWKYPIPTGHGIHHAMNPDVYQGLWGGAQCRDSPVQPDRSCNCPPQHCIACNRYYDQVEEILKYSIPRQRLAAFIAESIQGVGGTVQFPKGYLKKVYELVRNNGGICIADEVQTGFGRTGEHFWGFEMHGVQPDIVTMAKGIGNGFPLAAVVTTPQIASSLNQALHFNTFGGNPLACSVGLAVLQVIEEENTQKNCHEVGTYLLTSLVRLRDLHSCVGDVRGKGLMIGIELVSDKTSRTPMNRSQFSAIWEDCKDMGLLIGCGGLHGNVFRLKPPMCITKEDADFTVAVLDRALKQHTQRKLQ
ncbi:alanine--glyoxylate aminotransferase 2, mitochondrial [Anabrus simplex]|uniref:alanine--glyoxylate aminotransferase 2, mitochondrial n=1 Tax=Anabrus simplex TaxID=316456 RepID=UPI0035A2AF77